MDIRNNNIKSANVTAASKVSRIEELENRQLYSATHADIGINVNDASTTAFQKAVPVMKQMGITSVRLWVGVTWTKHTFTGVMQRAIDYHNAGFDVMVVVNSNSTAVPNSNDVKGWFQWAMTNSSLKSAVDRWEIGNEVDQKSYFSGSLQQYMDSTLKPAYSVLHGAGEKVVSAGVSWNPEDIKTMIGYGLLNTTDYIGFHPYANGVSTQKQHIQQLEDIVDGRKPLVASEWNVRGYENNKSAWAQAVEDAYTQVRDGFAFNYYFCLFVQNTPAGPGAIMNADGSKNTLFWNAVATFQQQNGSTPVLDQGNTASGSTGTISGVLWNDDDGDGVKDSGEAATGVRSVFIDANGNGKFDAGEKAVNSDSQGKYSFTGLKAGTYKVSRVFPSGYRMSNGANNDLTVALNPGQTNNTCNIGTTNRPATISGGTPTVSSSPSSSGNKTGTITGLLWNDSDGDGMLDSNEGATGARTVFIDSNGNGKLDSGEKSTNSDSSGKYNFSGLNAGAYKISRVFPDGYHLSNSANSYITVVLSAGQVYSGANIGTTDQGRAVSSTPPATGGTITGLLWNDSDGDGTWDSNEKATGSRTVFIDSNGNGKLDSGEKSTQSDANGRYSFTGLAAGTYNITRVFPDGFHLSNSSKKDLVVNLVAGQTAAANIGTTDRK